MSSIRKNLIFSLLLAAMSCTTAVFAAPGDTLFSDDFDDGDLAPWTSSNGFRAGVLNGAQVSNSSPFGAFTRHGTVTVTGPTFNAAVPAARLDIWIRRGSDAFSEDTDAGEDFVLEYRRADGSWATLRQYDGGGTNGQIFQDRFILPSDALHGTAALRVRQTDGSGFSYDFWHFDDVVVTEIAPAAPLGVGQCDDFENGFTNWTINAGSGQAGINSQTFQSPSNALFLNGGSVSVTSNVIDTSQPDFGNLTAWIRRGSDAFSENPDGAENLVVEYLNDSNVWVELSQFTGGGTPGQIFNQSYTLPADGRHAGFQVRFRQISGSGTPFDFWHVDDVCFEQIQLPTLQVSKLRQTLSDPINGTNSPLDIPGAIVQYTITVSNSGPGAVDADSILINDPLPADTELFVDTSGGDPISFIDNGSGLTFSYPADVSFSDQPGGAPNGYSPVPDADGFDINVTGFEINPQGSLPGASGGSNPGFSIVFRVRVR